MLLEASRIKSSVNRNVPEISRPKSNIASFFLITEIIYIIKDVLYVDRQSISEVDVSDKSRVVCYNRAKQD